MKMHAWLSIALVLASGCAAFKELEPDPPLSGSELGYIELKNGDDNFELDKDSKYFIKFPGPSGEASYLVLITDGKPFLHSYLTSTFNDGEAPITPLPEQPLSNDSVSVYSIDPKTTLYHWVIDSVSQDLVLRMRYRYSPQWRYTFERRFALFQSTLKENTVDRTTYNSIDVGYDVDKLDLPQELSSVQVKTARIRSMKEEMHQLEQVFPPDIAASQDTAYIQYVAFRKKVDDELKFQDDYSTILTLFKKEKDSRGNTAMFIETTPYFAGVISQRERFPEGVNRKTSAVLLNRMPEVTPYLDNLLRNKVDIAKITPDPSHDAIAEIYASGGKPIPVEMERVVRYINRFNVEVAGLESSNRKFAALDSYFHHNIEAPGTAFYSDLVAKGADVRNTLPDSRASRYEGAAKYNCAAKLDREITKAITRANDLQKMYRSAESIDGLIRVPSWSGAETSLRGLHADAALSGSPEISSQRKALVEHFEDEILAGVKFSSQQRIDAFIKTHQTVIDNVEDLYADSSFLPVYELTFSSRGPEELTRRRTEVQSSLDQIKYHQFPESSIRSIYASFTENPKDHGVEKARAIVAHGKFYRGSDEQIKGLITECDVQAAKWIVRPKEYRKLFALPVTSNVQGVNEYMFRIRLKIPSEAQFPVFDINVKLPDEIAEKAGSQQWYESITIDKKPIKNEGRFRITSPSAKNNYETLITPVQMDKAGNNILEVRFKYPGFRVFEVSTMAQVPIIRKN